jgi:hypothetical protein
LAWDRWNSTVTAEAGDGGAGGAGGAGAGADVDGAAVVAAAGLVGPSGPDAAGAGARRRGACNDVGDGGGERGGFFGVREGVEGRVWGWCVCGVRGVLWPGGAPEGPTTSAPPTKNKKQSAQCASARTNDPRTPLRTHTHLSGPPRPDGQACIVGGLRQIGGRKGA